MFQESVVKKLPWPREGYGPRRFKNCPPPFFFTFRKVVCSSRRGRGAGASAQAPNGKDNQLPELLQLCRADP